jgi:hypothetical protein
MKDWSEWSRFRVYFHISEHQLPKLKPGSGAQVRSVASKRANKQDIVRAQHM